MVDNNSSNRPLGVNSPWKVCEEIVRKMDQKEAKKLEVAKRDLSFEVLQYGAISINYSRDVDLWNKVMPIPFDICRAVYEKSKYLDSLKVERIIFPHYQLNEEERNLFDLICGYGSACGVDELMSSVYREAISSEECTIMEKIRAVEFMVNQSGGNERTPMINIVLDSGLAKEKEVEGTVVSNPPF